MTGRTQLIQKLNDKARTAMHIMSRVMLTQGISEMDTEDQAEIFRRVAAFDDFTEDNDPYGEHDFGAFDFKDERIFWKIDYYNRDLTGGSEDPASTEKTVRVLTIMLACEY